MIYRVIQEGLNNAAMHSKADTVYVRLKKTGTYLEAEVEDNGIGFDFNEVSECDGRISGYGLKSMRERVELMGGLFSLHSLSGTGTCIRIGFEISEENAM